MKKVLSAVLAGAMMAAMAVPAFAASKPAEAGHVYDSDGEDISSNSDDDVYGKADFSFLKNGGRSINIDGVVPGITMYIPLGAGVGDVIGSAGTPATPNKPDGALKFYKADADDKYDDTLAAELASDKAAAIGAIASNEVTGTEPWTDTNTAYYSNDKNELVAFAGAAGKSAPSDAVKYYESGAKNAYDTALAAADDDNAEKAIAALTSYEIAGTDAWKSDDARFYSKSDNTLVSYRYEKGTTGDGYTISLSSLTNDDYFKFDVDKDDNGSMVKKVEVVEDKKLGDLDRTAYLKIQLNDSTTTSDIKSNGTLTFKAKDSAADFQKASGSKKLNDNTQVWDDKEEIKIDYTFWINNYKAKNDDNPDSGDRVYFDPDDNEDNTLIWGDDRAGLFFEANDDASKFYARLSTKSDSEVYSEYGDPVNADLWFFDFVGSSTIPATSRATLTLGIPWDEDDDYTPNPEDCFIYEKQEDGTLVDVTDKFTYDEDNDGTTEIEGWSIKTRTLGTYVISDTELDLDAVASDDVGEASDDGDTAVTDGTGKEIPNTGSSDMVNVAVVAAAVSLAAAGAVAFKKASK